MADVLQGPTQSGDTLDISPAKSNLQRLLSDPNFISLLAGIGQRLDPTGVGGALGGATTEYQKAKSAQEAAAAIAARNTPSKTALTPAGVPGPTSETTTRNADGTYSTVVKGDSEPTTPAAPAVPIASGTAAIPFSLAPTQGPLDFRGLSAEQVPAMLQAYHEGERLRQANVGQILSAYDQESNMAAREAVTALNRETVAHMQRLAPFDVPKVQVEIRRLQNAGDVSELEANRLREIAPLNLPMAKAELASRLATVSSQNAAAGASAASAARSSQAMQQEKELFDINKPAAQAAAALYKETDPTTEKEYTIPGSAIPQYLAHKQSMLATARERALTHTEHASNLLTAQQKTNAERLKEAASAEFLLLDPKDSKGNKIDAKTIAPQADLFNLNSTKPYVYIYFPDEPGTKVGSLVGKGERHPDYSDKNVAVPIPQLDRRKFPDLPRNASEVYALAVSTGLTVQRVIEMMYEKGLGEKAPWLR